MPSWPRNWQTPRGTNCPVSPAVQVSPELIASAIRQIRGCMDAGEYGMDVVASAYLMPNSTVIEQSYAWMMAAMLIAHTTNVDSMTLRSLENSIWKGTQGAIF
jgi:hypothetical protein